MREKLIADLPVAFPGCAADVLYSCAFTRVRVSVAPGALSAKCTLLCFSSELAAIERSDSDVADAEGFRRFLHHDCVGVGALFFLRLTHGKPPATFG